MTKRRLYTFGIFCVLLLSSVATAAAQTADVGPPTVADTRVLCRNRMISELSKVHDDYRSVVFGSTKDKQGNIIVKGGGSGSVVRQGILEEKGRLTSELVAPLVDSYRAYRCRSLAICSVLRQSFGRTKLTAPVHVQTLGCDFQDMDPYQECFFGTGEGEKVSLQQSNVQALSTECDVLVQDTLSMERSVLRTAVAYDSGYRGLLQFSGMMSALLDRIPNFAFFPLRDMIKSLGALHQIPCYIGQCDMRSDPK